MLRNNADAEVFFSVGYRNDRFFFPYKSLYLECYATISMLADAHISSLGYLPSNWRQIVSSIESRPT